jgi:hypothetical protein
MVIDDLFLCSLQGFSPLQLFCSVKRRTATTAIPFPARLLNAQVAKIFDPSLPTENILMSLDNIYNTQPLSELQTVALFF